MHCTETVERKPEVPDYGHANMETAMETHFMAKMGKWMTPEEEARQKFIMRERDRERKRIKRLNPEYRQMERERDRFRKLTPRPSVVIPDYPKNITHLLLLS